MNKEQRQRIAEIVERTNVATGAHWFACQNYDEHNRLIDDDWRVPQVDVMGTMDKADADFIAHARDDVPWLVALVQHLEYCLHPSGTYDRWYTSCNEDVDKSEIEE